MHLWYFFLEVEPVVAIQQETGCVIIIYLGRFVYLIGFLTFRMDLILKVRGNSMAVNLLPSDFSAIAGGLDLYIKQRGEASSARRILASHINSRVIPAQPLLRPLALIETREPSSPIHGTRGLYKELLGVIQAKSDAEDSHKSALQDIAICDANVQSGNLTLSTDNFLDLVRFRRKYNTLRVTQDYVNELNDKDLSRSWHPDMDRGVGDNTSPPIIPTEILNPANTKHSQNVNLPELTERLEKAVLKAQLLLKREQKLLAKLQLEHSQSQIVSTSTSRLNALGMTRNDLITWIETELSQAIDETVDKEPQVAFVGRLGRENIQAQMDSSTLQYRRYISLRQHLISSVISKYVFAAEPKQEAAVLTPDETLPRQITSTLSTLCYLENVSSLSNEQKSITQQKSHMAIALAKHIKMAGQIYDRHMEESHLIPAHQPATAILRHPASGVSASFGDATASIERSNLSPRAWAWVSASAAATAFLGETVSGRLAEGGSALLEAQEHLLELLGYLGNDLEVTDGLAGDIADIWKAVNGELGVL